MRVILREPRKIVPLCIAALFFFTIYISAYPYKGRTLLYPVYRCIERNNFVLSNHQYNVEESRWFRIFFTDASKECVDMVSDNAESCLSAVRNDFNYTPDGKINIVIYSDYEEMAHKVGLGKGNTAMGVYYSGIISILEPEKWIGSDYNIDYVFIKKGPVLHELTHYAVDYKSRGNVPVWFTEGVALYEEYKVNGVEWGYGREYEAYYRPEQLDRDFHELDEIKAYKQSFLTVKYIAENYGARCINDIIRDLSTGKSLDQVFNDIINAETSDIFKNACHIKE